MEQPDKILNDAIEQMERQLNTCRDSTSCNLPMSVMLTLATSIREAHDVQNALARRLNGEIVERSQRQLEITGRLAALERDMRAQPHECKAEIGRGMATPFEDTRIAELERELATSRQVAKETTQSLNAADAKIRDLERDLANARADVQVHQSARQVLEQWEAEVRTALGVGPGESRRFIVLEIERMKQFEKEVRETRGRLARRIGDLEAQVAALQAAIDDVWALVEEPDGYGSPYWTESGLDDTTPAQAVAAVLHHLRSAISYATVRIRVLEERNATQAVTIGQYQETPRAEAMAALNAADRQSDDDQICGC